ncbi:MAG: gamma carbonic anhydrase family protein [Candidatus Bathyarchaeota archaeon]|nr:MAG: gamma carbonic anhydrase family protein [Candidatus Bathyarchaeota archaeon]
MTMVEYCGKKPKIDPTVFIASNATIIGDVEIGICSSVWPNAVIRGDTHTITIGKRVNIQDNVIISARAIVGDDVTIGHGAILHGCKVGNNVIIGMGSIILDDVKISDWVIVGAGTVITSHSIIPSKSLVLGIPGKVVRQLHEDDLNHITANSKEYLELANKYKKRR